MTLHDHSCLVHHVRFVFVLEGKSVKNNGNSQSRPPTLGLQNIGNQSLEAASILRSLGLIIFCIFSRDNHGFTLWATHKYTE